MISENYLIHSETGAHFWVRAFLLICWQIITKGLLLLLLCAQRKGIQSARILSQVRCCQGCYIAFCSLTVVVEHIDQNILALFVFQRNKMELHLLCVAFPHCSFMPWSMAHRWGSIDYLVVCVWVGGVRVSVCVCVHVWVYLYVISLMHLPPWEITVWASGFIRWRPFCCIITPKLNKRSQQPSEIPVEVRQPALIVRYSSEKWKQLLLWKTIN